MENDASVRTITLFLNGGHQIKLGGAVDVASLVEHLHSNDADILEIASETGERLLLRAQALLGIMDGGHGHRENVRNNDLLIKSYVSIKDFLSPEDHQIVVSRVLEREHEFQPSGVTSGVRQYRTSMVLYNDDTIGPMFNQKIRNITQEVAGSLGIKFEQHPRSEDIECQVTVHRDKEYFHVHDDNSAPETETRMLSYVYYFRTQRNAFFGGELKLYPPTIEHGVDTTGSEFFLIKPEDNSIVFFPSDVLHEVLPTYVRSKMFRDSRFTVNGWIRRTAAG